MNVLKIANIFKDELTLFIDHTSLLALTGQSSTVDIMSVSTVIVDTVKTVLGGGVRWISVWERMGYMPLDAS